MDVLIIVMKSNQTKHFLFYGGKNQFPLTGYKNNNNNNYINNNAIHAASQKK